MSSTQTSASINTPTNTQNIQVKQGDEEANYVYIDKEINMPPNKTYDFIFEDAGETVELAGYDYVDGYGTTAPLFITPALDKEKGKNSKALKQLDSLLYDTTYNFFHENPNENAVKIFHKEEGSYFKPFEVKLIVENLVRNSFDYLPKTKANCGNYFKIISLDAKLRSGDIIVDSKIKNTDIVLENGLFILDLIKRNRIRIKKCIVQIDDWQILCDSNDSFMSAIIKNDAHEINLQPDTRIRYQLKALKERAEFIQADIDLEFESGSIKLDDKNYIVFKDGEINAIDRIKAKKKTISPFALFMELNDNSYAPEILYNPEGLLKKGDNNNFVTLKYNQKRHDLSTIDGLKTRIIQTLSEAYNKNLKRDVDKMLNLVKEINNTTEDIDSIMQPWTQIRQSPEAGKHQEQPKNEANDDDSSDDEDEDEMDKV